MLPTLVAGDAAADRLAAVPDLDTAVPAPVPRMRSAAPADGTAPGGADHSAGDEAVREQRAAALLASVVTVVALASAGVAWTAAGPMAALLTMAGILALVGAATAAHVRAVVPSTQLPHPARVRRERAHRAAFAGVLGGLLAVMVPAAALSTDSWGDWTMLAATILTMIGFGVAAHTRLR